MSKSLYRKKDIFSLILSAQEGNNQAIEELIKRIQSNIYTMFYYLVDKKQDVSDLTQETLLKIAFNIKSLKNIKNFKAWTNQITTNIFYDYLKKQKKENNIEIDNTKILEIKDKIGCDPGEKCLFAEMEKLIRAALLSLPENLRIAIVLKELEGLTYIDISKITNTTLGTVKSRISRARIRIKEDLKEFI